MIFRYGLGVRSFDYDYVTVYGELKETRPMHGLTIAGEGRQKWGSLRIGTFFTQYLDDFSRRRASVSSNQDTVISLRSAWATRSGRSSTTW